MTPDIRSSLRMAVKNRFAAALIDLSQTRTLKRITVGEVVQLCGASRQTFYNHFTDKYALIGWILERDQLAAWPQLGNEPLYQVLLHLMAMMRANRHFYLAVANLEGHDSFSELSQRTACEAFHNQLRLRHGADVVTPDLAFAIEFYNYAGARALRRWLAEGMLEEPEPLAKRIVALLPTELKRLLGEDGETGTSR